MARKKKRKRKEDLPAEDQANHRLGREKDSPEVKASDYIQWLRDLDPAKGKKVVGYCRVSTKLQADKGNLDDQRKHLKRECRALGFDLIEIFDETIRGSSKNRPVLKAARNRAKKNGAIACALSTDRYLRSNNFHYTNNPGAQPTKAEFERISKLAKGVVLATLDHPNCPWEDIRSDVTIRGQKSKGNKGGRPPVKKSGYKKERREKELPKVLKLRKQGFSIREISEITNIAKS